MVVKGWIEKEMGTIWNWWAAYLAECPSLMAADAKSRKINNISILWVLIKIKDLTPFFYSVRGFSLWRWNLLQSACWTLDRWNHPARGGRTSQTLGLLARQGMQMHLRGRGCSQNNFLFFWFFRRPLHLSPGGTLPIWYLCRNRRFTFLGLRGKGRPFGI